MSDAATDNLMARRREAGAFLRSRRGRLAPSEVGLPQGFRRRTPGLRREEVAMLAGVGTTWYTWLEQGREIQPSNEVLSALAEVLRLDRTERHHLFSLYDRPTPERRLPGEEQVGESLRHMVDGLAGQPAFVLGWRWDILTWNRAAELVMGPYAGLDGSRPNVLDLLFSDRARRLFVDWENVARRALATFRADCAPYIGDPDFESVVARLTRLNPEFAAWWPQHDVAHRLAGTKRLNHPTVGRMHFAFSMLAVGDRPGMKLFVFTPVDEEDTPRRLSRLLKHPPLTA
ncbi:helix-turn-helix transcriptional regulator [Bradyrhizobium sp. S69]|uniref:helix-turn-helix transcriptional regulator n=1 Tax=Bradyrhizobium sp. S69 TaxID=1641856 RepID=UPI00131C5257|nr:helix-turn-helix transcriptional regulator [Bradyrhizobium sp. S69]